MTNNCYCYRGVYDMYRVGADPVKLNLYRKRSIKDRLLRKGRMYWVSLDVLHKIHEIYRTMDDTAHRIMHRIAHFERIVCKVAKLETPILAVFTALYVKALLYGCALIALTH